MTKYQKMHFLHHISANSHTCGSDAITFVGSMSSLEVTLTVRHILGLLGGCLPKIGGLYRFSVPTCKKFQFWPFLSFDKFQDFSVSNAISPYLVAFVAGLKWRQHRYWLKKQTNHKGASKQFGFEDVEVLLQKWSAFKQKKSFWSLTMFHKWIYMKFDVMIV